MGSSIVVRAALALVGVLALAGCGAATSSTDPTSPTTPRVGFASVASAARGQTVRWWMYGGDPRINQFVDRHVVPAAARAGVRLERVPIGDTADAVNRVVAERRAGRTSGGGVDLIWINGENFAAGRRVGLWRTGWADALPNARLLDAHSPLVARDFGVAVDGQESPWALAGFVFAYDAAQVSDPPRTFAQLLSYAKAHPGRVAYPAPPDFTGSAFVRQAIQRLGSRAEGLAFLKQLKPYSYRHGRVYPKSEQELDQLFADGQVDFAMSYNASFVALAVRRGQFSTTTRPLLIGGGALQNASFVTIPANAAHPQGAEVVANLLLSPRLQALMQDPDVLGMPSVLDVARLRRADRARFASRRDPYVPASLGRPLTELPAADVGPIDEAWVREVLR